MNIDSIMSMLERYNPTMVEFNRIRENLELLEKESYIEGYGEGYSKCSEDFKKFDSFAHAKKSEMDGYA